MVDTVFSTMEIILNKIQLFFNNVLEPISSEVERLALTYPSAFGLLVTLFVILIIFIIFAIAWYNTIK